METRLKYHKNLAEYFSGKQLYLDNAIQQKPNIRKLVELPWQFQQNDDREQLRQYLLAIQIAFVMLTKGFTKELMHYLVWLGEERNIGESYLSEWEKCWKSKKVSAVKRSYYVVIAVTLADFLRSAACHKQAQVLYLIGIDNDYDTELVIRIKTGLAKSYVGVNRLYEAEELFREVISLLENCRPPRNVDVLEISFELVHILRIMHRPLEAIDQFKRSLKEHLGEQAPNNYRRILVLNILGELHRDIGDMDKAEKLFRESLAIAQNYFDKNDQQIAVCHSNLARHLLLSEHHNEAIDAYHSALAILEFNQGLWNPEVGVVLSSLSAALRHENRLDEAEQCSKRALDIMFKYLKSGHSNPHLHIALRNSIEILEAMGFDEIGVLRHMMLYNQKINLSEE